MDHEEKNPIDVFTEKPLRFTSLSAAQREVLKTAQQDARKIEALRQAVNALCPMADDVTMGEVDGFIAIATRLADGFLGWLEEPKRDAPVLEIEASKNKTSVCTCMCGKQMELRAEVSNKDRWTYWYHTDGSDTDRSTWKEPVEHMPVLCQICGTPLLLVLDPEISDGWFFQHCVGKDYNRQRPCDNPEPRIVCYENGMKRLYYPADGAYRYTTLEENT